MAIGDMTLRDFLQIQTYSGSGGDFDVQVLTPIGFDSRLAYLVNEDDVWIRIEPLDVTVDELVDYNVFFYGTLTIPYVIATQASSNLTPEGIVFRTNPIEDDTASYSISALFPLIITDDSDPQVSKFLYELKDGYVKMGVMFRIVKEEGD